jgi:hypothetical protein
MWVGDEFGDYGALCIYYNDIRWILQTLSAHTDLSARPWSCMHAAFQLGRGNLSLHLSRMRCRFRISDDNALRPFYHLQTAETPGRRDEITFDAKMDSERKL